jgi:protein involved in temperature-dependent protein secretion
VVSGVQILGEGKPENQNHAMIFCFSEAIQTVDMNQENHLAEAFKMRNLLQVRAFPVARTRMMYTQCLVISSQWKKMEESVVLAC